jgi:hypothetical protein
MSRARDFGDLAVALYHNDIKDVVKSLEGMSPNELTDTLDAAEALVTLIARQRIYTLSGLGIFAFVPRGTEDKIRTFEETHRDRL